MTEQNDNSATEDEDWREGLLLRVRTLLIVVFLFSGFVTVVAASSLQMRSLGVFTMVATTVLIAVLSVRRISLTARGLIATLLVATTAVVSYFVGGFLAGPAVAGSYALILGALLFGQRVFFVMLAVFSLLPVTAIVLIQSGIWAGPPPGDFDPTVMLTWVRTGLISVVVWGAIGLSVLFVQRTNEGNLRRRERALAEKDEALNQLRQETKERRTAELMAARAQKLDAVGRLAAGIAHDFNNALLVIQGWNELRLEATSEEEASEAADSIARAVEQGAFLSRQLLAFARKDVRSPKYIAIDATIEESAKTFQRLLPASIALRVEPDSGSAFFGDEAQLQQVLLNLVINARDALPDGGDISIRTRRSGPPDALKSEAGVVDSESWFVLEIADNGVGMDASLTDQVFEPFFTTKEQGRGTGLGLATVLSIVRQSDGHIEIDSEPGTGTTVRMHFPAVDDLLVDSGPDEADSMVGKISGRVLVVEDDELALELISRLLRRSGMEVVSCNDGSSAIALLEAAPAFDLLCTDAVFPGARLSELMDRFCQHSVGAPILICSGYMRDEIAISEIAGGRCEYLAKPFSTRQLVEKIRAILPVESGIS